MFTTLFAPLVALYAAQSVYGIVTPTGPGGSDVFKAGSTCTTTWKGDTDSPSPWTSMDIELMSGDNFHMVHVTTVATNQDGSKDGQFSFPCPDVTPFSAIYFFQYSTTAVSNKTWTTRFTIAGEDGSTTPPANAVQPDAQHSAIPWGVGQLTDQSKVVPPPPSAGGTGSVDTGSASSASGSASASSASGSSTSVAVAGTTAAATVGETSAAASSSSASSRFVTSTTGSAAAQSTGSSTASAAASNGTTTSNSGSGAVALNVGGWKVASLTAAFAMAFAMLL